MTIESVRIGGEAMADQCEQCAQPVEYGRLLALLLASGTERHRDLEDERAPSSQLGDDLGVEIHASASQAQAAKQWCVEGLDRREHVAERAVVEEQRQDAEQDPAVLADQVADLVATVHLSNATAQVVQLDVAAAEHDRELVSDDRKDQRRQVGGIVLPVTRKERDDVARGPLDPEAQGGPAPAWPLEPIRLDSFLGARDVECAVRRATIHEHDLLAEPERLEI